MELFISVKAETINKGIKVKKKVDETMNYMEAWEEKVKFSQNLLKLLQKTADELITEWLLLDIRYFVGKI